MNAIIWKTINPITFSMNFDTKNNLRLFIDDKVYYYSKSDKRLLCYKNRYFEDELDTSISEDVAKEYSEYKHLVKVKLKHESVLYQELLK